jgi:hypothetical protein
MHSEQLGVWHFALQLALHVLELEAEMEEAKKDFEEQVQATIQEQSRQVKIFEASVKSFLEDK